jgi:hypothetical protein
MNEYDFVKEISNFCLDESKKYNGNDTKNYAYAFGMLTSQIELVLDELNLTKKQYQVLSNFVKEMK